MSTMDPEMETRLRQAFKQLNKFMLLLWRLGLGKFVNIWPERGGQIMVLVHRGRKTGLVRRTPVNYVIVDGDIYCTAGFGKIAHWYRNVMADPQVEMWLPDGWWAGEAEDVTGGPDHIFLMRQVLIASGFAAYAAGLDPLHMSDETLAEVTAPYRLLRIRRTAPRTGPGGPGDLAWVWPLATWILLPLALRRRK